MSKFSIRLKIALEEANMKPSVLAYRIGVDRSTISNYLNDRYKAKSAMITKMAQVLGVSPIWLDGFDVPMLPEAQKEAPELPELSEGERSLINCYNKLSDEGQELFSSCVESLGNFSEETQKLALRMLRSVLENQ